MSSSPNWAAGQVISQLTPERFSLKINNDKQMNEDDNKTAEAGSVAQLDNRAWHAQVSVFISSTSQGSRWHAHCMYLLATEATHTNDAVESNLDWIKYLKGQPGTLPKPREVIYSETRCSQISQKIYCTQIWAHTSTDTQNYKSNGEIIVVFCRHMKSDSTFGFQSVICTW